MKFEFRRFFKLYYLKFLRLKGDPKHIARGVAIGTFIGITPTMPFHTIALLFIPPLLRGNIIGAFLAAVLFCNPLTYLPQYYFSWLIGNWFTPNDLSWERIRSLMDVIFSDASYIVIFKSISHLGMEAIIVLLLGGTILATPFTIASYFISLKFFISLRNKRRKKHILD